MKAIVNSKTKIWINIDTTKSKCKLKPSEKCENGEAWNLQLIKLN